MTGHPFAPTAGERERERERGREGKDRERERERERGVGGWEGGEGGREEGKWRETAGSGCRLLAYDGGNEMGVGFPNNRRFHCL